MKKTFEELLSKSHTTVNSLTVAMRKACAWHTDKLTNEINTTALAEEIADQFSIYEDEDDYNIPEELFDLAVTVAESFSRKK